MRRGRQEQFLTSPRGPIICFRLRGTRCITCLGLLTRRKGPSTYGYRDCMHQWTGMDGLQSSPQSGICVTQFSFCARTESTIVVHGAKSCELAVGRFSVSQHQERLGHAAANGVAAVGISQGVKLATQILSVVILARLLTPTDFGIVAAVAPLTAFVILLQDLGLQQAIVQRRTISDEELGRAFWFTLLLGAFCAAILTVAAPGVAAFFADSRLTALTLATAPSVVIASISSVPTAILAREMRFKTLAMIDIASALIVFVTAIGSAWFGAEYWALLFGTLAGNVTNFVGVWWAAHWRPGRPSLQLPERGMLRFGMNFSGFNFVNFLARNLDNVLIGHFVGSMALGYYDRAYKLLLFPLANVNAPIARVAVPLLSRIEADKPRLRNAHLRITAQVALVTIPGMAALVATAQETVDLVFGPGWQPVVPIFAWLGLAGLLQPMTYALSWLLVAQARTATMFRWGVYSSITAIMSFVVGLHWGAAGVACAYAITDYVLRLPVLYFMLARVGPVTVLDMIGLQGPLLVAAGLTALTTDVLLRQQYGLTGIYLIVPAIAVSYVLAIAMMAMVPRNRIALRETVSLCMQLSRRFRPA
jgi:O-antigen/teichoic acid export membrane protein